jgi:DNA-binding NtrC family response regulator
MRNESQDRIDERRGARAGRRREQVLLVDDHADVRNAIAEALTSDGYEVDAATAEAAPERFRRAAYDVAIATQRPPEQRGLDFLKENLARCPDTAGIVIVGHDASESDIRAIDNAGFDCRIQPFHPVEIPILVRNALLRRRLRRENQVLRGRLNARCALSDGADHATRLDIPEEGLDFRNAVADLERELILQSLRRTNGNRKRAAKLLNLKRTTLIEKIKRIGIAEELNAADADA